MVSVFGATHVGICSTNQFQYIWQGGSKRERPAALYLCSSRRLSWPADSGSGQAHGGIMIALLAGAMQCFGPNSQVST